MEKKSLEISSLISALQKTSVHDHLCLLYEDKAEQFASAVPFIRTGLERGEKCIYINDDNSAKEVLAEMRTGGVDVDTVLKNGSLTIVSKRETYLRNGYFDPDEMIQFLKESVEQARKDGFKALRATGEMTWMLGDEPGVERAMEYEAKLNDFFKKNDCLALCQYNKKRFDPKLLIDVVRTHPLVISSNIVCKNFYYVPVEEFLKIKNGSRLELERFLQNLVEREHIEQERLSNLKFTESLDKINQVIQKSSSLEEAMSDALDVTLSIFDCDRAWLLYPSRPDLLSFTVPMERTKPEYPGALLRGIEVPIDPGSRLVFEATHASKNPVEFNSKSKPPIPSAIAKNFQVKSQIAMNIYPKVGDAYMLGLHQCSYERTWTTAEKRLLQEIGRRLEDGLTSLLIFRDLQASKIQYQNVIETSNEGIWMLNREHEITFINPRLSEILGYEKKEMLGNNLKNFVIPEELPAHNFQMQERNKGKSGSFERRLRRKNGTIVWTHISAVPLFNDKKEVIGAFAMITDITKEKLMDQAKTEFIALAAHQLRTPLSALKWYSEALLEHHVGGVNAKQMEYLLQLHTSNERMVTLIDALLCVSRLELGSFKVRPEPVDIVAVVKQHIHEVSSLYKEKNLKISETYNNLPPVAVLDAKLVGMVIQNIITNAMIYTSPGGTIDVTVSVDKTQKGHLQFMVADTGIGIPKEQQSRIFEKLFRADNAMALSQDGTGLGLYIAKNIVTLLGGSIAFTSKLNKGTTFVVSIPYL